MLVTCSQIQLLFFLGGQKLFRSRVTIFPTTAPHCTAVSPSHRSQGGHEASTLVAFGTFQAGWGELVGFLLLFSGVFPNA